jgi:hypothetical protein
VEVDVRLDEVVLHALEKDPQRRYQQVSQVKTAVDIIASSAAPPPPNADGMAQDVLARDYTLNIRSCLRRSWALIRGDFWPLVGGTALVLALLAFAGSAGGIFASENISHSEFSLGSSVLGMLVYGPLIGGLALYYLKKIRCEPVNIEAAFSGFSHRFLHLFLAGFVTWMLTTVGFICFILPGVYLIVAWWFTLILVMDKGLDFWPAMELSRKVITRHWWKFLGFWLVVLLLNVLGLVCLVVGFFLTAPLAMIAVAYAYEDIFGGLPAAKPASAGAGFGPAGTVRMPAPSPSPLAGGFGGKGSLPNP